VRTHLIVAITVCTVSFSPREMRDTGSANTYSHGETTCLQRDDGPGTRLRLRRSDRCEGKVSYPYLEVDIRELPIAVHKSIPIGADNWAFKCPDAKESCEQSRGGTIVFDHLEESVGKDIQTDGSYDLRFRTGAESGHFQGRLSTTVRLDCTPPLKHRHFTH